MFLYTIKALEKTDVRVGKKTREKEQSESSEWTGEAASEEALAPSTQSTVVVELITYGQNRKVGSGCLLDFGLI